ncbi:MAG: hypothetical protein WEA04_00665 [Candidatus Andersenbacteria bacterium]
MGKSISASLVDAALPEKIVPFPTRLLITFQGGRGALTLAPDGNQCIVRLILRHRKHVITATLPRAEIVAFFSSRTSPISRTLPGCCWTKEDDLLTIKNEEAGFVLRVTEQLERDVEQFIADPFSLYQQRLPGRFPSGELITKLR